MPKNQKAATPRGRPREYDPNQALARATEAFWRAGYSATSVEDLSIATKMNRPSLYGAFGDKRALYLTSLSRYVARGRRAMEEALSGPGSLRDALMRVYEGSLALYYPSKGPARGCFLIGTAATEAVSDPDVRAVLREEKAAARRAFGWIVRSEEHTSELQSHVNLVCRLLLEK